jgi:hypothetical protein
MTSQSSGGCGVADPSGAGLGAGGLFVGLFVAIGWKRRRLSRTARVTA